MGRASVGSGGVVGQMLSGRIDTARDILVGKVPDPKSQVEQITIALIYKFMDDMDAEAEELGGERAFFTGDFARYGWAKLMAPSLGGHEMLGLYGEGISKMPENPGIPALFRDIFKNAYLPYRDPETLKAFLKIIDWITIGYFCLEYIVRFVCSPNKTKFFFHAMNLVRLCWPHYESVF